MLAQGDRRGHVAADYRGEVYAIARYTGVRTAEVKARLGDAAQLPTIEQAEAAIASRITGMLNHHAQEITAKIHAETTRFTARRTEIVRAQRDERAQLAKAQRERWDQEARERAHRLRRGLRGLWDRLTGRHRDVTRQNEFEAQRAQERDRKEKDALIHHQLAARRALHAGIKQACLAQTEQLAALNRDIAEFMRRAGRAPVPERNDSSRGQSRKQRNRDQDRGPES